MVTLRSLLKVPKSLQWISSPMVCPFSTANKLCDDSCTDFSSSEQTSGISILPLKGSFEPTHSGPSRHNRLTDNSIHVIPLEGMSAVLVDLAQGTLRRIFFTLFWTKGFHSLSVPRIQYSMRVGITLSEINRFFKLSRMDTTSLEKKS